MEENTIDLGGGRKGIIGQGGGAALPVVRARLDAHTCDACRAMNGMVLTWGSLPHVRCTSKLGCRCVERVEWFNRYKGHLVEMRTVETNPIDLDAVTSMEAELKQARRERDAANKAWRMIRRELNDAHRVRDQARAAARKAEEAVAAQSAEAARLRKALGEERARTETAIADAKALREDRDRCRNVVSAITGRTFVENTGSWAAHAEPRTWKKWREAAGLPADNANIATPFGDNCHLIRSVGFSDGGPPRPSSASWPVARGIHDPSRGSKDEHGPGDPRRRCGGRFRARKTEGVGVCDVCGMTEIQDRDEAIAWEGSMTLKWAVERITKLDAERMSAEKRANELEKRAESAEEKSGVGSRLAGERDEYKRLLAQRSRELEQAIDENLRLMRIVDDLSRNAAPLRMAKDRAEDARRAAQASARASDLLAIEARDMARKAESELRAAQGAADEERNQARKKLNETTAALIETRVFFFRVFDDCARGFARGADGEIEAILHIDGETARRWAEVCGEPGSVAESIEGVRISADPSRCGRVFLCGRCEQLRRKADGTLPEDAEMIPRHFRTCLLRRKDAAAEAAAEANYERLGKSDQKRDGASLSGHATACTESRCVPACPMVPRQSSEGLSP